MELTSDKINGILLLSVMIITHDMKPDDTNIDMQPFICKLFLSNPLKFNITHTHIHTYIDCSI